MVVEVDGEQVSHDCRYPEGFELAERDLEDIASHGDQHRFPDNVPPPPEEQSGAVYGEADEAIPEDE